MGGCGKKKKKYCITVVLVWSTLCGVLSVCKVLSCRLSLTGL